MVVAVILCGGKGKRLRPHTDKTPKPMLKINEKPILEHQIELLKKHGITDIILCSGYMHEKIEEHFSDGSAFGVKIEHSVEKEPLGSAGALKLLAERIKETFIFINGDNMSDIDLSKLLETHKKLGKPITVSGVKLKSPYGILDIDRDKVIKFKEKPILDHWINAGFVVMEPEVFDTLPDIGSVEDALFPIYAQEGKVSVYLHNGYWTGVDTIKDFEDVQRYVKELGL